MSKAVKNVVGEVVQVGSEVCTTEAARGGPRRVTYKIESFEGEKVIVRRFTKFGWGQPITRTMTFLGLKEAI